MSILGGLILKPVSAFSAEAQAVIDLMTGLTGAEENAIAVFVDAEVTNGNWGSNYDEFWCAGLITEANALIGWKGVKTATNNGATKTANGFSFNGTTDYIDSNWDASNDGINFTQNDALIGVYVYAFSGSGNKRIMGSDNGGTNLTLISNRTSDILFAINNNISTSPAGQIAAQNLYVANRIHTNEVESYINGSFVDKRTGSPAQSPHTFDIYVGARNTAGSADGFANCTIPAWIMGGAIGFDHSGFNTNLNTLLTSLGVI